ncbi:MAG TPA: tRNA (adenosine(37)-N6)-dimethylallyltransferase MiaA [Gammaproteobacteria bacterium]|jgi:tRNA dimethylallyltransferase|nr:tRNA (adenosine(37)-N6)-dimethylallyltransferase MiaA [Gammaproteobacteria bacterium]
MSQTVITLRGPTASGKTDIAISLIKQLPIEIVSVDSVMVYRGLNIGSAKPNDQILDQFPHHLINISDPENNYSLGKFFKDVNKAIQVIIEKKKIPFLVGGTMMYFNILSKGLSNLPSSDDEIRKKIEHQAEVLGWPELHKKLSEVDPLSATKIKPNDKQRIQRALEVIELTGKPLSKFFKDQKNTDDYNFFNISLFTNNRDRLYQRINSRFSEMLNDGLVDEVKGLLESTNLSSSNNSMKSIGYREICVFLENKSTLKEAEHNASMATRRLAKRQITWLRSIKDHNSYDIFEKNLIQKIQDLICQEFKL